MEKNLNIDTVKSKLAEQIEINSKMREKILLLDYLDDTLNLGFKEQIFQTDSRKWSWTEAGTQMS